MGEVRFKMSLTPQDNSRAQFPNPNPAAAGRQHVFQVQPNLPAQSPSQQQQAQQQRAFNRPTHGGIRHPGQQQGQQILQHKSPYTTPYAQNNNQVATPRQNGVSVKETLEILHRENPDVRYLPRDIYNARAAIKRDPSRVEATAMEQLPTFYKKPPMTFEEKLRAELRTEVANAQAETEKTKEAWRKEVEELKEQIRQKDKQIQKFEMFIDICNERVMVQRERLTAEGAEGTTSG